MFYDLAVNLPKDQFEPVVAGGGQGMMAEKIISAGLPYLEIKSFQRDINIWKEIVSFFEIIKILFKIQARHRSCFQFQGGWHCGIGNLYLFRGKEGSEAFSPSRS